MLGNTWRLPLVCTGPSPGSIVTEVASLTDQRRVADCPRSIELGSAVNCAITGAFDGVGGGGVVTTGGGAAGGGAAATGAFFLHPTANTTSKTLIKIVARLRLLNSVCPPVLNSYLPQIGISFLPWEVSGFTSVPSASMVKICILPLRLDENTRCRPSGAKFGFSLRPAPCVN